MECNIRKVDKTLLKNGTNIVIYNEFNEYDFVFFPDINKRINVRTFELL